MKMSRALAAIAPVGAALLAAPVWAIAPTSSVQVTYAVESQAVPALGSPAALGLLALFLGVLALSRFKRAGGKRLWSALLLAGLAGGLGLGSQSRVHADLANAVQLSSGNPATGSGFGGPWTISNDLSVAATLTGITVIVVPGPSTWNGSGAQPCSVGLTLAAGDSCTLYVGSRG